jgi:phage terminase large subunit-like protein
VPWTPEYEGEIPSLGPTISDWIESHLVIPDGPARGTPFVLADWQYDFTYHLYALNPATGKRINRRGAAILAKGIGKSPWAAALSIAEFVAPVLFDGWDANGRPVGRPWETPWIQIAATAEDQTENTYASLLQMLEESDRLHAAHPEIDAGKTRVFMRGNSGARIESVTSEAGTREGQRITFAVMDETGLWRVNNGGKSLAATMRRNATKTGGSTLETTNSFVPGEESVAEDTHRYRELILEGRTHAKTGLVYRHTQAPPDTDMSDRESLLKGLRIAYMETPWIDYDRLVEEIWDPATDPQDARRFYLNQIVSSSDAWIPAQTWDAAKREGDELTSGEAIALGFDGSRDDDSTALVACRVNDGRLFLLGIWEKPDGPLGEGWAVDREEVDAAVTRAFTEYEVKAFLADPPHWQDYIDKWTAEYGPRLKVKASRVHPIEFWTSRTTAMVAALERFTTALADGSLTHGGDVTLTRHVLNAKRKMTPSGLVVRKDFKGSPKKIDAAVAATLAYEARSLCIAANQTRGRMSRIPTRIR